MRCPGLRADTSPPAHPGSLRRSGNRLSPHTTLRGGLRPELGTHWRTNLQQCHVRMPKRSGPRHFICRFPRTAALARQLHNALSGGCLKPAQSPSLFVATRIAARLMPSAACVKAPACESQSRPHKQTRGSTRAKALYAPRTPTQLLLSWIPHLFSSRDDMCCCPERAPSKTLVAAAARYCATYCWFVLPDARP